LSISTKDFATNPITPGYGNRQTLPGNPLAEDVAGVYRAGSEQLKRAYNLASFKRLCVLPEWDDKQGQMVVHVSRAELSWPYALLLADNLAEDMLAEAEAIRARP
jgi:hypothetical protein